jgi:hypothetical protein
LQRVSRRQLGGRQCAQWPRLLRTGRGFGLEHVRGTDVIATQLGEPAPSFAGVRPVLGFVEVAELVSEAFDIARMRHQKIRGERMTAAMELGASGMPALWQALRNASP